MTDDAVAGQQPAHHTGNADVTVHNPLSAPRRL
jgi:hypothetical protein